MNRNLVAVAVASAIVGGVSALPASADPGVGRPTDPACFGQMVRTFAQQFGGAHHAAEAFGVTNREAHNIGRGSLCGRTSGIVPTP
jgi:hypothetical protein